MQHDEHRHDADASAFLSAYDPAEFDRPSLTVDVVLLSCVDDRLEVLLHRRPAPPFAGAWALPGGFVALDEALDLAAARIVRDKAGLEGIFLEQLYTFGAFDRDPRTRVVSVAYVALVDPTRFAVAREHAGDVAPDSVVRARIVVPWSGITGGEVEVRAPGGDRLEPAFDHASMVGMAVQRLRGRLDYSPIGYQLLPPTFTLRQLQEVHEVVRGESVNKDSFRRRMLASGELRATGEREAEVGHRPAELYRFVSPGAV
jgi:8-oxo-dGTP diphosphatase